MYTDNNNGKSCNDIDPKSELGILNTCTQCQKRKVKCDGAKPSCLNCARRSECCVYRRSVRYKKVPNKKTTQEINSPQSTNSPIDPLGQKIGYFSRFSSKPQNSFLKQANPIPLKEAPLTTSPRRGIINQHPNISPNKRNISSFDNLTSNSDDSSKCQNSYLNIRSTQFIDSPKQKISSFPDSDCQLTSPHSKFYSNESFFAHTSCIQSGTLQNENIHCSTPLFHSLSNKQDSQLFCFSPISNTSAETRIEYSHSTQSNALDGLGFTAILAVVFFILLMLLGPLPLFRKTVKAIIGHRISRYIFMASDKLFYKANPSVLILLQSNALASSLGVFLLFLSPILMLFFFIQLKLVIDGVTSNEYEKWGNIHDAIDDKVLYIVYPKNSSTAEDISQIGYLEIIQSESKKKDTRKKVLVKNKAQIKNIYDHGIIKNFKAVFFPRSLA
ncbi:hypothetical protein BB561_001486 [Smittium simulii]|uniref:Zn(2)-C6 fungal-type domain-containing protein n=1 Tax=Smittium simulii TaxID=133385 RepID=A0A2T9YUD1_9FUNG|nr:hypothetical protein BB561_001486 [Smittium simulii]